MYAQSVGNLCRPSLARSLSLLVFIISHSHVQSEEEGNKEIDSIQEPKEEKGRKETRWL